MNSTLASQTLSQSLVNVAMGRQPADLLIRNGKWACVQSGEIFSGIDIAVKGERIAFVGEDARHTLGEHTRVIEANGAYLVPGLLDAHMHVESGMLTVTEFARAVIPHGTTGMFIDPHEIANVFGLPGVKLMVEEAVVQPIHVWVQVPSCVPSAVGFETPGATLEPDDIKQALTWPGIIGLGEMMNFPGVAAGDAKLHAELMATRQAGKVIGGHYASRDLGIPFHGYVAGGPEDDHEGTTLEDALVRLRQGMKVMLRHGSAWQDVAAQVKTVTELGVDSRHLLLCTDDCHSQTLVHEGHVDRALRAAIAAGVSPMVAIQMTTLNTAEHFGLYHEVGLIAPGRFADILIVNDLMDFHTERVIARGQIIAQEGKLLVDSQPFPYPDWALKSIHLKRSLTADDFRLPAPMGQKITAHVIGIIENHAPTKHLQLDLQVLAGEIRPDRERDVAKIAVIERHHATGRIQVGLIHGFGFNCPCAVATTVAHDCHHLIVVGTDEQEMALAANELARVGGGQVVVREGKVLGLVELCIGGLMSNEAAHIVAGKAASVLDGFRACGCLLNNPNMQLSLAALVVIPELRISDLGLVDVSRFEFISVLEKAQG